MSDQFKVGVTIDLVDRFSGGLKVMSQALSSMQTQMKGVNTYIGEFKSLSSSYSQIASVGKSIQAAGLAGLKEVIDPAREYVHQLNLMNMNGVAHLDQIENIKTAWKTAAAIPTSTPTENLARLGDLRTILPGKNSMQEARDLLPTFDKAQAILDASQHMLNGHSSHDIIFSMAKAVEMGGHYKTKAEFAHHMDQMTRVMTATGGRVTPEDYQNTLKHARAAKLGLNDEFLYTKLPELILEMKGKTGGGSGGGPGAMIMAGYRAVVQGIMSKATAGNLLRLGLLQNPVLKTTTTGTTVTGTGGIVGNKLFAADPSAWVSSVLVPALERANPKLKGNDKALSMAIAQTFKGAGLTASLFQELQNKVPAFGKFKENLSKVPHLDKLYDKSQEDADQGFKALDASMKTLRTAVGQYIMPVIAPALTHLAHAISKAGAYIQAHPIVGQTIGAFMGALALVGTGITWLAGIMGTKLALSVLKISFSFLKFAGGVGLAITIVTLMITAIMNWDKVMKFAHKGVEYTKALMLKIVNIFPGLKGWLAYFLDTIGAIKDKLPGMAKSFMDFWNKIMGAFQGFIGAKMSFLNIDDKAVDTRWNKLSGDIGKLRDHGPHQTTINNTVHIKTTGDHKDLAKKVGDGICDGMRRAGSAHPLAGGNHTSYSYAGSH